VEGHQRQVSSSKAVNHVGEQLVRHGRTVAGSPLSDRDHVSGVGIVLLVLAPPGVSSFHRPRGAVAALALLPQVGLKVGVLGGFRRSTAHLDALKKRIPPVEFRRSDRFPLLVGDLTRGVQLDDDSLVQRSRESRQNLFAVALQAALKLTLDPQQLRPCLLLTVQLALLTVLL
jgi:hypothetical protein